MLKPSVRKKYTVGGHGNIGKSPGKQLLISASCLQLCWVLNSHLLQCRAVVKTGQIFNLVVRQLPTTIHKAHITTVTSCGFIAWEIMGVTGLFELTVGSVSKAI